MRKTREKVREGAGKGGHCGIPLRCSAVTVSSPHCQAWSSSRPLQCRDDAFLLWLHATQPPRGATNPFPSSPFIITSLRASCRHPSQPRRRLAVPHSRRTSPGTVFALT
ncbi:hypothetical protein SESBI_21231 [Sesbania bispinosa]|nr:hypothetical protein SESBI_21231 [Sesbania bispinosa]